MFRTHPSVVKFETSFMNDKINTGPNNEPCGETPDVYFLKVGTILLKLHYLFTICQVT